MAIHAGDAAEAEQSGLCGIEVCAHIDLCIESVKNNELPPLASNFKTHSPPRHAPHTLCTSTLMPPAILKWNMLDTATEVVLGDVKSANSYGTKRVNITDARGGPLLVRTPTFNRVNIMKFAKKGDQETGEDVTAYFSALRTEEKEFFSRVIEPMNKLVTDAAVNRSKDYFGKMIKEQSVRHELFASPITVSDGYPDSFKSTINKTPCCQYYDKDGNEMTFNEFMDIVVRERGATARAVIQFTHVYIQSSKKFGYKSSVRSLQLQQPLFEEGVVLPNKDDGLAALGFVFSD